MTSPALLPLSPDTDAPRAEPMNTAPNARKETIKRKSLLMTMYLRDMERLIAPERVTIEMIRSLEWKERQKAYISIFEPVLLARQKGKSDGTTPLPSVRASRVRVARLPSAKE